ncbi:hypothetical protein C6N75_28815, partial [Streptomyces solincola]
MYVTEPPVARWSGGGRFRAVTGRAGTARTIPAWQQVPGSRQVGGDEPPYDRLLRMTGSPRMTRPLMTRRHVTGRRVAGLRATRLRMTGLVAAAACAALLPMAAEAATRPVMRRRVARR